jgi:hypothetical protein
MGCLTAFDASITDNIKQWDLYRAARYLPFLDELETDGSKAHFQALERDVRKLHDELRELRLHFRRKLNRIQTLRDGVRARTVYTKIQV